MLRNLWLSHDIRCKKLGCIMSFGKFMCKIIQSIPSWEMTKYYGRVCLFQLNCIKYRIQTSEAWFHFLNKFAPQRIKCEEKPNGKAKGKEPKKTQHRLSKLKSASKTKKK